MVEVDVRDERRVDPSEPRPIERYAPPEVPHAVPQDGVRQQTDPVKLDQDGRVSDVGEAARDGLHDRAGHRAVRTQQSAAITSTARAIIRIAETGW